MLEAGSGFRFATETLQMRFCSPVAQADHLQCHCAVKAFLPGAVNYALTAPTDFLQQLVIAKVTQHSWWTHSLLSIQCWQAIIVAGVIAPGYRFTAEQTEAGLKQTSSANAPPRGGGNFRAALCTEFGASRHVTRRTITRPNKYCRKSWRRLRTQHRN